jgi:hypothetical protein
MFAINIVGVVSNLSCLTLLTYVPFPAIINLFRVALNVLVRTPDWELLFVCVCVCVWSIPTFNASIIHIPLHSPTRFVARRRQLHGVSYPTFRFFGASTGCKHLSKCVERMRASH